MKKCLIAIILCSGLSSCYVQTPQYSNANNFTTNKLADVSTDAYEILDNIEYSENFSRTNILFVGVGTKKKSEEFRRELTYQNALKKYNIDGILNPSFKTKYYKVPLVVAGHTGFTTTVYGRAYRMRKR
ncbi:MULTISPECIES: hypothetical protein [unclassified Arcicella]|uniref:hypothetical protein n=1 Tax=unclassified Arcicella TaxID=2644986 RepID=UPI002864BD48|nr:MULTISPECIES: hypothetical protein [unclassified Arcicella]MDR6564972.1 hypothetical protein [Arcicella sp. BE51]MDR6814762.1 hypothetical protein [Arcicella sp. BE140]MDR6826208.1 hypothetical protein [Arcicella sp. BE139]